MEPCSDCFLSSQITLQHDPEELAKASKNTAAMYIACGIDPTKVCTII